MTPQPPARSLKFGGELLEDPARLRDGRRRRIARDRRARGDRRWSIVHGGGKEIDAALKAAGIEKRQVDGLRITDEPTLDVVVAVLAGAVNTRFVAALTAAGVAAVGLTGADGRVRAGGRRRRRIGRSTAGSSTSAASAFRATRPTRGC